MIQGIIFDFNGVLLWDGNLQEDAWRQYSASIRGTPFSLEEIAEHVHGRTNRHTMSYLTGRKLSQQELGAMIDQKETIYQQLCLAAGEAFSLSPGASDLLDFLVQHGIPHTIATASGKGNLDFFVQHLELERWFALEQIAYDDGTYPGKPAPDIYRIAANRIGVAPARCMVIEDSRSGIVAAHRAGIGKIVAISTASSREVLQTLPGVDTVIDTLADVDGAWFVR